MLYCARLGHLIVAEQSKGYFLAGIAQLTALRYFMAVACFGCESRFSTAFATIFTAVSLLFFLPLVHQQPLDGSFFVAE